MKIFADCNLANCSESCRSTRKEFGLRQQDLLLVRFRRIPRDEVEKYHSRIIEKYGEKVGAIETTEGKEVVKFLAW